MPRNTQSDAHFTNDERQRANSSTFGSISKRLGAGSHLPFGHCHITLVATQGDAVATPSGHIYGKEAILQYLLDHKQKYQKQEEDRERAILEENANEEKRLSEEAEAERKEFIALSDEIKLREVDGAQDRKRKRDIDISSNAERVEALKKSSPWLPSFTPSDGKHRSKEKSLSKRCSSPNTGRSIRAKDLIPLNLERNEDGSYLCSVTKKVINNQAVIALRNTHTVMLEEVAKELAYPTSSDPVTGKSFNKDKDIVSLQRAMSSFAASGVKQTTLVRQALV